jgi:hypothetical protein
MSLIQDALKRKAEETVNTPAPAAPAAGPAPSGKNQQLLLIALVVLLLGGVLAALVGLSLYLIKPKASLVGKPVATVSTPEPAVTPEAPVQPVEPAEAKPEITPEKPVPEAKPVWPELTLTGIAQSGGQSLAVLNGKMIPAGRNVGDVTLVEVNDGHVVVEYCGERRTLYINE